MSNIKNAHIQGNLTLSANTSNIGDHGSGILLTDYIQENNTNAGIQFLNSNLDIYSVGLEQTQLRLTNDLTETTQLLLNGSANVSGNGVRSFTIINNSGSSYIQSKGGIGIKIVETSGNITIQSSTESINNTTAALVVLGGASINKSIIVDKEIRGNDGYHLLYNTATAESVLQIENTSTGGYSSIDFKDSNDTLRLQIGYGNSTSASPLTSQAYIQSSSGSLLLRSNNTDSILLETDGSVEFKHSTASTNYTSGAITSLGGIAVSNTTDATGIGNGGALSIAGGASIAKKLFIGTDLDIAGSARLSPIVTPSSPVTGKKLYVDSLDGFLKSIDPDGNIKNYNPNTTKGDITTHNGTTDIRLPVGSSGQVLSANPSVSSGLQWIDASFSSQKKTNNTFTLYDSESAYIIDRVSGSWYSCIAPLCLDGASCIYIISKSSHTVNRGHVYRMCNNPSLINDESIGISWNIYKSIRVNKNYTEGNGDYLNDSNKDFDSTTVSLSGTSWVSLGTEYNVNTGAFHISIYSYDGGPCNTFVICKSNSSLNAPALFILSAGPSSSGTILSVRWLSNSGIEISKNLSNNDGEYSVINNFQNSISGTITLSGVTPVLIPKSLFNFYENKSFILKISSDIPGSPKAIFFVSKNTNTNSGTQVSNRSPGITSSEQLYLTWSVNSLLEVYKSGINYDGIYNIEFAQ